MKISRTYSILLIFFALAFKAVSQPILIENSTNHVIIDYLQNNPNNTYRTSDTLSLPFFDDFSYNSVYPSSKYWTDNFVFVNRSFGDNPPSMGVATFDAIDDKGKLYGHASSSTFLADMLTSKYINLESITYTNPIQISTSLLWYYSANDDMYFPSDSLWYNDSGILLNCKTDPTTYNVAMAVFYKKNPEGSYINTANNLYYFNVSNSEFIKIEPLITHVYSPSDSIYMSFYYQPQGLSGNAPEFADSLVLQFSTSTKPWTSVWRKEGSVNTEFTQVMIPIDNLDYFTNSFRFRFMNYASTGTSYLPSWNSNCDFWNIDYVLIDKGRSTNKPHHDDIVFINKQVQLLEQYTNIPWKHYNYNNSLKMDSLEFSIRNLNDTLKQVFRLFNIYERKDIPLQTFQYLAGSENINPLADMNLKFPANVNYFNSTEPDTVSFSIIATISSGTTEGYEHFRKNDTLIQTHSFKNYYAYDDGTSENGFGLSGTGTQNALLAYKFTTLKADTLRGISMFFNRTINDANQKYFILQVWKDNNGKPGELIHSQTGQRPMFPDGLNKFHYYALDTARFVSGTFYVGWKQTTTDLLNVGFDVNNDVRHNTFYNIAGSWLVSPYEGALMIRPVFSDSPVLSNSLNNNNDISLTIFPNPTNNFLNIKTDSDIIRIEFFDYTGRKLINCQSANTVVDVSGLEQGIYLVKIETLAGVFIQKVVIRH